MAAGPPLGCLAAADRNAGLSGRKHVPSIARRLFAPKAGGELDAGGGVQSGTQEINGESPQRASTMFRAWWVIALAALVLFGAVGAVFRAFTVDDAFISYRFARNVARGLGPVPNPGERVEGVSNLPWTVLLGAVARAGVAPERAAPVLSALCGLLCVAGTLGLVAWRRHPAGEMGRLPLALGACIVAGGAPLALWSASGMETSAYALAIVVTLWLVHDTTLRRGISAGVVAALRPEGILLAGALLAERSWRHRPAVRLGRMVAGVALVLVPLVLFRIFYYGDVVPNPVHAKAPGFAALGPGILYVTKLLLSYPLLWIACLRRVPNGSSLRRRAVGLVLVQMVFTVWVGGDHFAGHRFIVAVWPCLALAAAEAGGLGFTTRSRALAVAAALVGALGLTLVLVPDALLPLATPVGSLGRLHLPLAQHADRLAAELRHAGVAALGVAAWLVGAAATRLQLSTTHGARPRLPASPLVATLFALGVLVPQAWDPQLRMCRQADGASRYGRIVGTWLHGAAPATTVIATNAAGALPYAADLPSIDMLGLADRTIAKSRPDVRQWVGHERGDAAYVLGRRPGVIILGGAEGALEPWPFPGDLQLAMHPEFRRDYVASRVPLHGPDGDFDFVFYRRRDSAGWALGRGAVDAGVERP